MRYENSLTSSVEYYLRQSLAQKITAKSNNWNLNASAEKIRDFLCDPTTINTPDFVIRRYIQTNYPEYLPDFEDIDDLSEGMNYPWEQGTINFIADVLEEKGIEQGVKIEKKEWRAYLSGEHIPARREKLFMLAFVLKMNVEDTMDLLLACHMEPYSARYPLDLICLFCQKDPGRYTWAQADQMLNQFLLRRTDASSINLKVTEGMTAQMQMELEKIFKNYTEADAPDALVSYMASHSGEFVSYTRKVSRKKLPVPDERDYFIPGYSIKREKQFRRFTQYLAVLYPGYFREVKRRSKTDDSSKAPQYVSVPFDTNGVPHLTMLVRSMLIQNNLLDLEWDMSKNHTEFSENVEAVDFETDMRKFWQNYLQNISAVDRLIRFQPETDQNRRETAEKENKLNNKTFSFFKRTDVLVFLYFLIVGIRKAYKTNDQRCVDALYQLTEAQTAFDEMMEELLDKIAYLCEELTDADQLQEKMDMLRTCFDILLSHLDYENLYYPCVFDRLIYTALLSDFPQELMPYVLCYGEWV